MAYDPTEGKPAVQTAVRVLRILAFLLSAAAAVAAWPCRFYEAVNVLEPFRLAPEAISSPLFPVSLVCAGVAVAIWAVFLIMVLTGAVSKSVFRRWKLLTVLNVIAFLAYFVIYVGVPGVYWLFFDVICRFAACARFS